MDPLFEQIYNEAIMHELNERFGPFEHHHVDLDVSSEGMVDMVQKMRAKGRRGEVVMVIPDEQGQIRIHTKSFYPKKAYRLMTGGLKAGEKPEIALLREVEEETGFKPKIERCLAVITYNLINGTEALPFVSYLFLTGPTSGQPRPTDPDEKISDFQTIPVEGLADIALELRNLEGRMADWGIFRAISHEIALAALDEK